MIVRAEPATSAGDLAGALVITRDGRLVAAGTSGTPIIFASGAVDNNSDGQPDDNDLNGYPDPWMPGDAFLDADPTSGPPPPGADGSWFGVFVFGSAPATQNCTGLEEGRLEFLDVGGNPPSWSEFGGALPGDDSGSIQFVRVRSTKPPPFTEPNECCEGIQIADGFTLAGVGDGTTFASNDFVSPCWRGFADLHAHPLAHLGFGHRESVPGLRRAGGPLPRLPRRRTRSGEPGHRDRPRSLRLLGGRPLAV